MSMSIKLSETNQQKCAVQCGTYSTVCNYLLQLVLLKLNVRNEIYKIRFGWK